MRATTAGRAWLTRAPVAALACALWPVGMAGGIAAFAAIGCWPDSGSKVATGGRPNIVLVVADTLRADHFGSSGGAGHPTPVLDRLRSEGTYFTNVYATASWTTPSTVSIFLSQYPSQHGSTRFGSALSDTGPTFVEQLRHAGYRTGGWSANPLINAERGFKRGFHEFELVRHPEWKPGTPPTAPVAFARGEDLVSRAMKWLDNGASSPGDAPFFLYFQLMEAHTPYLCPPTGDEACRALATELNRKLLPGLQGRTWVFSRDEVSMIRGFYDADVNRVEIALEELSGALADRGLLEDTWLIITADHGEMLGEHGYYLHGNVLYEETLRVPLLIRPPKSERSREVGTVVSLIDIAPTILDLAGVDSPDGFRGRSLLPAFDAHPLPPRPVVAELFPMRDKMGPFYLHVLAVIDGSTKYLLGVEGQVQRLDLSKDEAERNPRLVALSDLQPELAEAGVSFRDLEALEAPSSALSPEVTEELRALGYLEQ